MPHKLGYRSERVACTKHFHDRLYERFFITLEADSISFIEKQISDELTAEPPAPESIRVLFDCKVNGIAFTAVYSPVTNLIVTAITTRGRIGRKRFEKKFLPKYHKFSDHTKLIEEQRHAAKHIAIRKGQKRR